MPKEYINSRDHGRQVPILESADHYDGGDAPEGPPRATMHRMDDDAIKLSWGKDYSNVSLTVVDRDKDPDGLGSVVDQPDVKTINLDRDGLNRLIRFLRRARDDAYGKDE